jgi:hypothetical protein
MTYLLSRKATIPNYNQLLFLKERTNVRIAWSDGLTDPHEDEGLSREQP